MRDEIASRAVVDAIHQYVGKLEIRALRECRSFRRAKWREGKKRCGRVFASQRRGSPRLFLRPADVDDCCIDEMRLEGGVEILEGPRENDACATAWKRGLHEIARAFPLGKDDDRRRIRRALHDACRHQLAAERWTISWARRSTSRAFA